MSIRRSKSLRVGVLALIAAVPSTVLATQVAHSDPAYTVTTLHFAVNVGPANDQACDVIGDLYLPADASPSHRVPAILTTNGFGGSKADQAGIGAAFAARDYGVLSYSGLGFGGSTCKITLDDPDYDGKAASQLVSYLGGAAGIAFTDAAHTTAAPVLNSIVHDATDHAGVHDTYDPRVGMIGGSYGGEIQFAAAGDDPRVDTIVPLITWNDLSYSLGPNSSGQSSGVLASSTPGLVKLTWGLFFSADGVLDGLQNAQADPSRVIGCPNFATFVCPALITAGTQGYFNPSDAAALQHASVESYMSRIKVPVLLMQGENDTLFNINEAIATFTKLRAQHTPVQMVWQSWGHSGSTPAPGELSLSSPDPATQYETARVATWFDHYLKDVPGSTGPLFAYFRDWISYSGIATPAYATSNVFPLPTSTKFYFSGKGQLVSNPLTVAPGKATFYTAPAGLPTGLTDFDAIGNMLPLGDENSLGTYATWQTSPLTTALKVAGSPSLKLTVSAPAAAATQGLGPAGQLALFAKIYDVGPDGKAALIHQLIAPFRIADVGHPVTVTLPGIVHQFAPGHSLKIMIAGGDLNYRGGVVANWVTINSGANQVLTLPIGA